VLATLLAETTNQAAQDTLRIALQAWLPTAVQRFRDRGLHGGQAGTLAGLRLITDIYQPTIKLVNKVKNWLVEDAVTIPWRTANIRFDDYDLFSGPSGVLLANIVGTTQVDTEITTPLIQHLTALADPGLSGFRIGGYQAHESSGWMQGGINTGLARGVPGVLAALVLAGGNKPGTLAAIRHIAEWLINEAFIDECGVISWTGRSREGSPPPSGVVTRQAYCYGNPGVSWSLWLGGEALDCDRIRAFALEGILTYCRAYDPDIYFYGKDDTHQLGICHVAAGTLSIADAFATHANLAEAAQLRDTLIDLLYNKLDRIIAIGQHDNSLQTNSLLMSASGMLAALLTATGSSRSWLPCLALK